MLGIDGPEKNADCNGGRHLREERFSVAAEERFPHFLFTPRSIRAS